LRSKLLKQLDYFNRISLFVLFKKDGIKKSKRNSESKLNVPEIINSKCLNSLFQFI
jgi:hypothetical protein